MVDVSRIQSRRKLASEVFGVDRRSGSTILANVDELGSDAAESLVVVDQRDQGFAGEPVRNRVMNLLSIDKNRAGERMQIKVVVVELQINPQLFQQRVIFLMTHLMETKQRRIDVELLSQEPVG